MVETLRGAFKRHKDNIFIIDSITGAEYTYGQIEDLSLRLSSLLWKHNLRKGEKVAILLPNRIEFVLLYFSCMHLGAIPVPINVHLHPREVNYILSNSGSRLLFAESSARKVLENNIIEAFFLSSGKETGMDLIENIKNEDIYAPFPFTNAEDLDSILIMYTSGTTSRPKGVQYSYKNMTANALAFIQHTGINSSSRFYEVLSLAYMAGFYNLLFVPFLAGGSVVLAKVFNVSTAFNFWRNIDKYDINSLWVVPSIISILLSVEHSIEDIQYFHKEKIKVVFSGTAPLSDYLKTKFEERFSLPLLNSYGLSELLFVSANSPRFSDVRGVGKVLPGGMAAILDDNGQEAGTGAMGEITVASTCAMDGYYNFDEGAGLIFKDGRFFTGDLGYIDTDGYLHVTDRKKDIIIKGGINISPREIEEVLLKHALVREVAVVGIPDSLAGEKIAAVIKAEKGVLEEDLARHCHDYLASFKVPAAFIFVEDFPRSVTGKIQKEKLRQLVQNTLLAGRNDTNH